jgi:TonB family protein
MMKYFRLATICLSVLAVSATAFGQGPKARGIELYGQKNYPDAIRLLSIASKDKATASDPAVWSYLGLANIESGKVKNAQKAFEQAVKLDPKNSSYRVNLAYAYMLARKIDKAQEALKTATALDPKNLAAYYLRGRSNLWEHHLDDALQDSEAILAIDPSYASAYILKSDVLVSKVGERLVSGSFGGLSAGSVQLKDAKDTLEQGLAHSKSIEDKAQLQRELESITAFYEYSIKKPKSPGSSPESNVTPLTILTKPKASYTNRARDRGVTGNIQLAVLFGASGRVEQVIVMKRLGYGLDENAIGAAAAMQFKPKMVDGKPVSTVMIIEYRFDIY